MAITRCPYCRAIIDEKDQFCTNCGTQLLFPEDEAVEEDIPGDRIIDVAEEEKEYEIPPPGVGEDEEETEGDSPVEDDLEEEVIIIDEIEEAVRRAASGESEPSVTEEPPAEEPPFEDPDVKAPPIKDPPAEEPPIAGKDSGELRGEAARATDALSPEPSRSREEGISGRTGTSSRPLTFDTGELEKSGRTAAELGNLEIDRWLKDRWNLDQEKDRVMPDRPKKDDTLPPWAGRIKSARSEEATEDEAVGRPPIPADSGIGLPERVTQADLPFGATPDAETEGDIPWEAEQEPEAPADWDMDRSGEDLEEPLETGEYEESDEPGESVEEEEVRPPHRPFRISEFLKSKAFDLLFLAGIWLVSTLFAARMMETTIFRLLPAAAGTLLGYYAALVALYFFLFRFFLGETLGDRMFRRQNADRTI